jgi:hypothetical protein
VFTWWSLNVCGQDVEAVKKLIEETGAKLRVPVNCQPAESDSDAVPDHVRESEHPLVERAPGGSSDV